MDLKKLAEMARIQRAVEDDNANAETIIRRQSEPQDEIYIPIDDEPEQLPNDGCKAAENDDFRQKDNQNLEDIIAHCFPDEKAYNIELERLLPFRSTVFSVDGDISALKSSIMRIGITEPILVRSTGNGEYEILSGNRRRRAAEELLWTKVPCRIGDNEKLTDEDAKLIVIESNRDRFSALKLSEQIRVSAILGERAADELTLTMEQVHTFEQLDRLEQDFLEMLDGNLITVPIAEQLSVLKSEQQKLVLKVLNQHPEIKFTAANIPELVGAKHLTEENIAKILKPKPPIKIAVPAETVDLYMNGKSSDELTEIVTKAICIYFEEKTNGSN
jgi:ParB family chromosome partitioning protein